VTNVYREIVKIVGEIMTIDPDQISPDTEVRSLPGADSMKMLEVIVATERLFKVELPDELPFNVTTIGEFVAKVQEVIAEQSGAATPSSEVA
jgi:acyl carrier protein